MRSIYFFTLSLQILALYLNSSSTTTITFPFRNVIRSIDLGTGSSSADYVPTGKCEDVSDNRVILNLPGLGVQKLYVGIIESAYATCLSLRENYINEISVGTFNELPILKFLDLSHNRIPHCNLLTFGGHAVLRTLILDENELPGDDVGHTILSADRFPRLEHLYLRKNALRSLQFPLRESFPCLVRLYLSDNKITSEAFLRDPPATLAHLHLERNEIHRFSGEIQRNLYSLFLDGNRISTICYRACGTSSLRLENARRLRILSVSKNNVMTIERDAFAEACNLTTLNLSHNRIQTIERGTFDRLALLKDLSLSHNQLTVIPDFGGTVLLTSLLLDHNSIEVVPTGSLSCLPLLKWLSLGNNRISRIEAGAMFDLPSLEELDLSENKLDHLVADWMRPQSALRWINVRGNRFSLIERLSLRGATSLTRIDMQRNPVKQVGMRDLIGCSPDVVVYLDKDYNAQRQICYERCERDSSSGSSRLC